VPISIGSNISSIKAQRQLSRASDSLSSTYERLSSGQRINKASDDAAGLAVSTVLDANKRIFV
jgi:flagellin